MQRSDTQFLLLVRNIGGDPAERAGSHLHLNTF
jgi:hypothetical protein